MSFEVGKGEMVAVMGPSGSGKSTLLYTVSGMDTPTSGEVDFCGSDIAKMNAGELSKLRLDRMGFIFQQMYMLKNLTVLDNIILPAFQSKENTKSRKDINPHTALGGSNRTIFHTILLPAHLHQPASKHSLTPAHPRRNIVFPQSILPFNASQKKTQRAGKKNLPTGRG